MLLKQMFKYSAEQIFTEMDFKPPFQWKLSGQKSAILNEIEIVSKDLRHLCVGASRAIKGLIVFTWLQDNADDAREAPNFTTSYSLMQQTKVRLFYISNYQN